MLSGSTRCAMRILSCIKKPDQPLLYIARGKGNRQAVERTDRDVQLRRAGLPPLLDCRSTNRMPEVGRKQAGMQLIRAADPEERRIDDNAIQLVGHDRCRKRRAP